jgi:hypothetical protein
LASGTSSSKDPAARSATGSHLVESAQLGKTTLREGSLIGRQRTGGRCVGQRVAKRNDLPSRDVR